MYFPIYILANNGGLIMILDFGILGLWRFILTYADREGLSFSGWWIEEGGIWVMRWGEEGRFKI